MKIEISIEKKYKSLGVPCNFEIPSFCIITGINGSGKTHLLEALSNKSISKIHVNGKLADNRKYLSFNELNPKIEEICDPSTISVYVKDVWRKFRDLRENAFRRGKDANIQQLLRMVGVGDPNTRKYIRKTYESSGKTIESLTESDFFECFDISFIGENDLLKANFALLFKNYHKLQEENRINHYYQSMGYDDNRDSLSEQAFKEKFGEPPWILLNQLMDEIKLPYMVNSPVGDRFDSSFTFKLIDKLQGFEISSNELSTGEKTLMSLLLAIYNTNIESFKPDFILIDEPDAGLHPSFSSLMVRVLKEYIVEKSKIPVIITSHSPATIISSEGSAIFQMKRGGFAPERISTQKAIEDLTSDVPFLKISTEKRRAIFVESQHDANYYELLVNIYSRFGNTQIEPVFLPARSSNGSNCSDVIEIVESLYKIGNDQVYGIIDWDLVNKSSERVWVLGGSERYAIENYLLDPLLMGILFIRENKVSISEFKGLSMNAYAEFSNMTIDEAQIIINEILKRLDMSISESVNYQSFNNWKLEIAKEFTTKQGHELEKLYKSKFPFLKSYRRESELKIDVIQKVISDYPIYAPIALSEIIFQLK